MRKFYLTSLLLLLSLETSFAQDPQFFTGFFPEAALTKKLKNDQKIIFKIEHQDIFYNNSGDQKDELQFTHYRTDLMGFYDFKLNPSKSIAFGVFHRIQKGANANRIIQQFAAVNRLRGLKLAHRFRTDQTFTKGDPLEIRLRYRLATEIPLSGSTLDPGEHYLLLSNEPIFSLQGGEFEIENRLVLSLGKLIASSQKLEWSLDYRTDKFIQEGFRTRLWAKVGYFYSF
ncbi:DUF2490 domain-containing protein [Algoriphagus halophytocola]|uniref:DUF2490 domain-containing protein n=1 Tax=Algoriphagus halophytocola TaxID=2991499 RepID=A0ABY6MGN6_9BACT|nr:MULTISPECIES: DUF2490 domain-containing protein [unclassified Algoriphagus]UZD22952.1 DUF2490 domain-containing protein [Algoriphagus sp. TR-M5]WBL44221.1 DUF2490 domain-containing protein [Algoriphagus sp. TR-M9]